MVHFDFMDPPATLMITIAIEELHYLGALSDKLELTTDGELMSEFPMDPQMARVLVSAPRFGCSSECLTIIAMLSVPNCFMRPREKSRLADAAKDNFRDLKSDHLTLLNVFHAWASEENSGRRDWCYSNFINSRVMVNAENVRNQLLRIMNRL